MLVRSERFGPVVLGGGGVRHLADGHVDGADPLEPFGPLAEASLRRLDGFATVGDLVVVSMVDPDTHEVAAFEELVGSHGGLGGAQTEAFVLYPSSFAEPARARSWARRPCTGCWSGGCATSGCGAIGAGHG